jgi:hypothetical protein
VAINRMPRFLSGLSKNDHAAMMPLDKQRIQMYIHMI